MHASVVIRRITSRLVTYNKLSPDVPIYGIVSMNSESPVASLTGIEVIDRKPAHPGGETLVEPQLTPPVHGDEITEPLMCKLVSNYVCYPIAIAVC